MFRMRVVDSVLYQGLGLTHHSEAIKRFVKVKQIETPHLLFRAVGDKINIFN